MRIGIPKEIKDNEFRVSLTPSGARALTEAGHEVFVEKGAGDGSGFSDSEYEKAGARLADAAKAYEESELVVKVKELQPSEYAFIRKDLIVFTFFHFAAVPRLADEFIEKGATAIAYETIDSEKERLPILAPMSEIAGRLSVQAGAFYLMKQNNGRGVLLSGVPGVERGRVAIIGGGNVGVNAAKIAIGLGADVEIIDISIPNLRKAEDLFGNRVRTIYSTSHNIEKAAAECDLLIGAAHSAGLKTPKLVTKEMVKKMKKGSVIVDVSVDQGGCVETIRPTTHSAPVYEEFGVIHYGVANMPGAVPRTSTFALTNASLPYILKLADLGFEKAVQKDLSLRNGVNIHEGGVTHPSVAASLGKQLSRL